MSTSRHTQPRRPRPSRPAGRARPAGQFGRPQVPAHHHHAIINASNAAYWLDHIRTSAIRARVEVGPEAGDTLDQMADDLAACIAARWRDRDGRAVVQWQYHMWITPHPSGLLETIVELWPEHLAA
ncbi:MAG: hypothetical protein Q7V57_01050 [Actinomycetota bacterium]|nr:hypothetical protein [Actinomycetota bacterium]